jgi:hypothetical protein
MINKDRLQMYVSLTKITIVLCWLSLFSFWAIKLFGGNWFEVMVENENFVEFSNVVQNTWVKYLVSFFTILIGNYFLFGAIVQDYYFKGAKLAYVVFALISIWFVSNFVPISFLSMGFWYGYVVIIMFGVIFNKGWKKSLGLISIIMQLIFTSISMVTRNIPLEISDNYLIAIVTTIDTYIMYALYYLYLNLLKKEV